jgi:microcystin-dependent protein
MANPFVGQLSLFPFNFAPVGWAFCAGQLLPISQYTALFSLLGVQFGGDGRTNFALPDLRGRAPIGQGQGPGLSPYQVGSQQGAEQIVLTNATVPSHSHAFPAFASAAATNAPNGALPAEGHGTGRGAPAVNAYTAPGAAVSLAAGLVAPVTIGGAGHNNLQPYLTLNWCIALQGVFPARS